MFEIDNDQNGQPIKQPIRKSMFQILQDYDNLMQEIEMEEGEVTEEIAGELVINEEELENKLKSYKEFMRMLSAKLEFNKEDRKKSTARDKSIKNRIKYMRTFVVEALNRFGSVTKSGNRSYKGNDFSVYLKKTIAVNTDNATISSNYKHNVYSFMFKTVTPEIKSLLDKLITLAGGVEEDVIIDKTLLKNNLKLGIYQCDNVNCKAYTTHNLEDCTCPNLPTLTNNVTPIFK
jgi:hypothetical protein